MRADEVYVLWLRIDHHGAIDRQDVLQMFSIVIRITPEIAVQGITTDYLFLYYKS